MNTSVLIRAAMYMLSGHLVNSGYLPVGMQDSFMTIGIELAPAVLALVWKLWDDYKAKKIEDLKVL